MKGLLERYQRVVVGAALVALTATQTSVAAAATPNGGKWVVAASPHVWAAPPTKAPPPPPPPADVETAEQLYGKLDYEAANSVAERVVKLKGQSHDQLMRAYRILAITHAVLDNEEKARDAFIMLLTLDPDFQLDTNLGPKVSTPFSEAKGHWKAQPTKPGIEVQVAVRAQEAGVLRVTTRDPTKMVKKVTVAYRWGNSGEFTTSTIAVGDGVAVEVAASPPGKTRLDYYVQASDERESVVLESGTPQVPKTAFAEAKGAGGGGGKDSGGGFVGSPTFWIIAGAVVVAGGSTAAFFALRPKDPPTQATLTPTIGCGTDKCR